MAKAPATRGKQAAMPAAAAVAAAPQQASATAGAEQEAADEAALRQFDLDVRCAWWYNHELMRLGGCMEQTLVMCS
jgi:hypothetical protein